MADQEEKPKTQAVPGSLITEAATSLKSLPSSSVPPSEYARMKARAEWEDRSRSSPLQVSGKLPKEI
jgi:hypothetical protein